MSDLVYSWLDEARFQALPDLDALFRVPPHQIARAWGDALIEMVAERRGIECTPPVAIRRTAVLGWLSPVPPPLPGSKQAVQLVVDPHECAAAQIGRIHPLFSTSMWRQLGEWLADTGHSPERVYEEISPVSDPTGSLAPEVARQVVETTSPGLLNDVLGFFEDDVDAYLKSWHPLSAHESAGGADRGRWEVIVPRAGLIDVIAEAASRRGF
jgi:hypothetical protein